MHKLLSFVAALFLALTGAAQADEAEARKARSIAVLEAEGVPYITHLPVIETEATSLRRSDEDVIHRTIALAIVAVKGETGDHALGQALIGQFAAEGYFTPDEQAFMDDPAPDEHTRLQFSWRYEGVHVMLWALGIYPDLGRPDQITDVPLLADTLRDLGPDGLRAKARLRPQAELLDAADLIYRLNWAVVQARLDGTAPPAALDPGVVFERHYALNWLIGYLGQAWDDISTDT
ncbi:DUF4272 domain-containing protein [Tabrizicola sp.]|uniref:DUF4272 domain-containing protein n=1 Tax=Tabrizicola sp. TaxID=2005166 RepID=UPI003F3E069A